MFQTDVSCFGYCDGSAFSMPSGGIPPYTYFWGNGSITDNISGLCAGGFDLIITDNNNCISGHYFDIFEPLALNTSINTTDETSALNDGSITLNANGGIPPYTYSIDGGILSSSSVFTGLDSGTYTCEVIDANGCIFSSFTFVNAYIVTGIVNINKSSKKLFKVTDLLGKETKQNNQPLLYLYDNGTVEKRIVIE